MSNILTIDNDLRKINIPDAIKNLGVESDDDVLRLHFSMPRMYGAVDLSDFDIRINYMNARNEGDVYVVADKYAETDTITFSWLVDRTATAYMGNVKFIVCLKLLSDDGIVVKEFNTTVATLPVLEGLETGEQVVAEYADVLEQWRHDLEEAAIVNDEKVEEAVGSYFNKNPIGNPVVVSTASSMTDTDAIYLYTGTESGYKQGDWYYHNGSAWVSGGTYGGEASGLYDGSVFYGHISEITYEGEPTEDEIVPDEPEETIVNLFDKDTMALNGYVDNNTGAFYEHATAKYVYMPVEVGKYYSISAVVDGTPKNVAITTYGVKWFDANKNVLYRIANATATFGYGSKQKYSGGSWAGTTEVTYRADDNGTGITIDVPAGVAYVGVGLMNTNAATPPITDVLMFEEGTACHDYVAYKASGNDKPTETPDVSTQGNLAGCEITGLFGATLADTYARRNLAALAGKIEGLTGLSDDAIIDSGLRKFGYRIEPALDDIPIVHANGDSFADMTKDKNEVKMSFKYISKTAVFGGWMKIKWQGNLSLNFSKNNFTVKLYGDKNLDRKLKVDLRGWGAQNKFVWKANYIDRSHARNIVSARLWSDMVASRPTYDARMMYAPNHGAVDGFPFLLYVNGEYYGLMTWNIPKDGWMAEMTEDNANHCMLCAELNYKEGGTPCDFAVPFYDGSWEVEFPDEISNGLKYSFNDIVDCVVNDTDAEFKANIDTHLDIASAIDYYLFFYLNAGTDSLAKNMLLMTYDGVKWYCGAYDMDGTWGRQFTGSVQSATTQCPEGYQAANSLLWQRIEACFGQELHDRYFDLRETILSKEYIMAKFEQFENQITAEMFAEDQAKNGMNGVSGTAFLQELSAWLDARFAYVDAEMQAFAAS